MASTKTFVGGSSAILIASMLLSSSAQAQVSATYRGVSQAVRFDLSPPLWLVIPEEVSRSAPREISDDRRNDVALSFGPQDSDPLVQSWTTPTGMPAPSVSFDGPSNIFNVTPPDPVGDVGPNHYVAMSNLAFAIYNRSGALLFGPAANNTLWQGFGGDCQNDNAGDPIVLYDQLADRWLLTQLTSSGPTYSVCIAISQTGSPTGAYYRYAFSTGTNFPGFPKYAVWPDAYYLSTLEFTGSNFAGVGAYAIDRPQMLSGDPTTQIISFLATPAGVGRHNIGDGLLPSDLDGSTPPPLGSPNFFVGSMDNGGRYGAVQDALTIWRFHADFVVPANSTFTLGPLLAVAPFDSIFPCSPGTGDCIAQPGTPQKLDILSYHQRVNHRLAYRNFGTHKSLVTNQTVEATPGVAGIRWYEIRGPHGTPLIFQQGTYAPGVSDGIQRWIGSIAMDKVGNMALGFSASNATTTFPSVLYTGRLVSDPLGTMPQGEGSIINGTGSQTTTSARWGDYTSMNVDPLDDCTFWYVNQWVPVTSQAGWRLRIGAFRFPGCAELVFADGFESGNLSAWSVSVP